MRQQEQGLRASSKTKGPELVVEHLAHRKNLGKMRAVLKISSPQTFSHMQFNPKQD